MARRKSHHPTDAELEILAVLWDRGPLALGPIYDAVRDRRDVARTTVATMLGVMLDKGLVRRHDREGGYVWAPAADRDATARGMMGKVIDAVFGGSALRVVAHLVEEGRLSPQQVDEIRKLLDSHDTPTKKRNKGK